MLRWSRLDWERELVWVERLKGGRGAWHSVPAELRNLLLEWRGHLRDRRTPLLWVVPGQGGLRGVSRITVYRAIVRQCERHNVPRPSGGSPLRRSAICHLTEAGYAPRTVAAAAGHETLRGQEIYLRGFESFGPPDSV